MTDSIRSKPASAYHHGDLREALLAACREALETTPPEQITLKALALKLGVSQPAPYRHFANREALLQTLAEDGFRRFTAVLEAAQVEGPTETVLERSLSAYVRFGQANRGVYRLMFASSITTTVKGDTPLAHAARAAFEVLLRFVSAKAPAGRAQAVAVWIWASLHGIVMLESEGLMRGPLDEPVEAEQVVAERARAVRARR